MITVSYMAGLSVVILLRSLQASGKFPTDRTSCCVCRELVTKTYNKANGYETDCEVIYGDTDSVMVHFKVPGVARAMELGREAAEFVSKTFIKPIKLEFEKVCSSWQQQHFLGRCCVSAYCCNDCLHVCLAAGPCH